MKHIIQPLKLFVLYLALWEDFRWAQGVLIFVIWMHCILNLIALCWDEVKDKINSKYKPARFGASTVCGIVVIVCLVSFGWFWTAIVHASGALFEFHVYKKK